MKMRQAAGILACVLGLTLLGTQAPAQDDSLITPATNWLRNRLADFMDIFGIGAGITTENRLGGPIPPSFGAYAEATTLLNLGWITHNGGTIEWEGRGAGLYGESRTLYGLGPYRAWKINQGEQVANFYKDPVSSQAWSQRMQDLKFQGFGDFNTWLESTAAGRYFETTEFGGDAAKVVVHRDTEWHKTFLGLPRGWQAWEYIGAEVAVCEPFLTHMGVTLRAGFDLSEVFDFVLGFVCIDFKQDDLRSYED